MYKRQLREVNEELHARVEDLGRISRENELLGELGAFLQASQSLEEVYAVVQRFAAELFGGSGALYTLDDGELEKSTQWGADALMSHPEVHGCWALRRGEIHVSSGHQGLACAHATHAHRTTICMPVMSATGPLALLHLVAPEHADWDHRRERVLRAVADRLGAALTTLALQQRLRQESIRCLLYTSPSPRD